MAIVSAQKNPAQKRPQNTEDERPLRMPMPTGNNVANVTVNAEPNDERNQIQAIIQRIDELILTIFALADEPHNGGMDSRMPSRRAEVLCWAHQ